MHGAPRKKKKLAKKSKHPKKKPLGMRDEMLKKKKYKYGRWENEVHRAIYHHVDNYKLIRHDKYDLKRLSGFTK